MKMARRERRWNRKVTLPVLALAGVLPAGAALADYGYTNVSEIPMAVDFTYGVAYDGDGRAWVRTDYPYESAGADKITLVYRRNGEDRDIGHLTYDFARKGTENSSYNGAYEDEQAFSQAIRKGEVVLDRIYIYTAHFNQKTDWFLVYDVNEQRYTEYSERTFAQDFNAMGAGGTEQTVYYEEDEIISSRTDKRMRDADLVIEYDADGEMTNADINLYAPSFTYYSYDPATGLFGGRTITELGYEESDLAMEPLAARGTRTETIVASDPVAVLAREGRNTPSLAGGILTGVLMGLALFRMIRRRKEERKAEQDARRKENENTGNPEAYVEPAEMKTFSSGR